MAEQKDVQVETQEELNLDKKVTVKSIAGWTTGFQRIADGIGDVTLPPYGTIRLSRNEIISQVQTGNKLFSGLDGRGSHATLYIDDAPTRRELEFETADMKQLVFSKEKMKELFGLKTQSTFEKNFREAIKTRAEKNAAINAIKELNLNDYKKIRFVEAYTGFKMD
ncbi:MAG: hypothetical protein LUC91_00815 [Prevotella sp.]|nr:hypothetical protein [Prevotella sp.]